MKGMILSLTFLLFLTACAAPSTTSGPTALQPTQSSMSTQPAPTNTPGESPTAKPLEQTPSSELQGEILLRIVPEESVVSYEVGETFINENNRFNTAIGNTSVVNGEIYANPANPQLSRLGSFTIDVSTFSSDSTRRDNAIRRDWLQSSTYPIATFVPRSITSLPDSYVSGQPYTFEVQGELTVKQTTRGVSFVVTALYDQEQLTGTAETEILMSDFGVGPISIIGILNTQDNVIIRFNFVARP